MICPPVLGCPSTSIALAWQQINRIASFFRLRTFSSSKYEKTTPLCNNGDKYSFRDCSALIAGCPQEKGEFAMFPNNPFYIDNLVHTKQEDILRELPDRHNYDLQETDKVPVRLRAKTKIWAT